MRILTLITGLLLALPSLANWQLSNDESQFNFVTTKKNSATEVNQFTELTGHVSSKGDVHLAIDLSSVNTNIPIRDERMQEFLFETELFPKAVFTAEVNAKGIARLNVGELTQMDLMGEINLHGIKQIINTRVQVVKLKENTLQVNSLQPIIIQAKAFKLGAGVEKLKALAGLPSISYAVPVTFSLAFTQ